jgi:autotransporter-associated beta strand protein
LKNLDLSALPNSGGFLNFGSTGNTGTIVLGPGVTPGNSPAVTVAFGTLQNGGGLNALTSVSGNFTDLGSVLTVKAGATVAVNDVNTTMNDLEGSGTVNLGTKTATVLTVENTGSLDVSGEGAGAITGAGQVSLTNTNLALIFSGTNTYMGGTTVGAATVFQVGNGGTTGSIAGPVSVGSGGGALIFDRSNAYTFSGTISGDGVVEQDGTSILTLSGTTNTYLGGTQINSGDLVVTNGNALGKGNVTLASTAELRGMGTVTMTNPVVFFTGTTGATLDLHDISTGISDLAGSGSVTLGTLKTTTLFLDSGAFGGVISGAGSLNISGSATFTGAPTYTGGTELDALGDLQLGNGGTTGSIAAAGKVVFSGTSELIFDRSNAYTFSNLISGGGDVVQRGSGVLTLTGNNGYTLGTLIEAGVLVAGNSNALGSASAPVTIFSGPQPQRFQHDHRQPERQRQGDPRDQILHRPLHRRYGLPRKHQRRRSGQHHRRRPDRPIWHPEHLHRRHHYQRRRF